MVLRKRGPTQLQLRKTKRSAPWLRKLNAMVGSTAVGFGASRALKRRNNIYAEPSNIQRATRRVIALRRKNTNRKNMQKMKLEGFKISRFQIQSVHLNDISALFDHAGFVPNIYVSCYAEGVDPYVGSYTDTPFQIMDLKTFTFCPQWPGSKLGSFERELQGSGTTKTKPARFGLLTSNSQQPNDGFKYNSRAVSNVFSMWGNAVLTLDKLDFIYNHINVYKTYVTIDLMNLQKSHALDVYVVVFRYKDSKYFDLSTNSCQDIEGKADNFWKETWDDTDILKRGASAQTFESMLRSKKLPKGFKIRKWKKVTLAPNLCGPTIPVQGGQIPSKCHRTIKMKFGARSFYRKVCTTDFELMSDEIIKESWNKIDHVMIIPMYNMGTNFQSGEGAGTVLKEKLMFRIRKTNIWKEQSN